MSSERGLFIIADGMGGHAAGEVASEMAARIVAEEFRPARGMTDQEMMAQMVGAIRAANEIIKADLNHRIEADVQRANQLLAQPTTA